MDKNNLKKMEVFSADFNPLKAPWCSFSWTVWGGKQSSRLQRPISAARVRVKAVLSGSQQCDLAEMPPAHPASATQAGDCSLGQQPGVTCLSTHSHTAAGSGEAKGCSFPATQQSQLALPCH